MARSCRSGRPPSTRPGTPPGTWRCCSRGTAACLFTGDAATNFLRLGVGPVYEKVDDGMDSLRRLADLSFETALFSHGRPLAPGAAERFRARFARG